MSEADKIASLNIGSMETTADDRLSSDPAYLTSRVAELERELRLVRGVATQADATIDQLAKQRDAHMAEIIRAREIIERISGEREAFFVALVGIRLKCVDGVNARPFERLRVIHDVACIAIDALADEAEACALFEEAGGE
jgi:hypothetical protein